MGMLTFLTFLINNKASQLNIELNNQEIITLERDKPNLSTKSQVLIDLIENTGDDDEAINLSQYLNVTDEEVIRIIDLTDDNKQLSSDLELNELTSIFNLIDYFDIKNEFLNDVTKKIADRLKPSESFIDFNQVKNIYTVCLKILANPILIQTFNTKIPETYYLKQSL